MCRKSNNQSCRKSSFPGSRRGKISKRAPLPGGNHSVGCHHDCEAAEEVSNPRLPALFESRLSPRGNARAIENAEISSTTKTAEKSLQRDYAERREGFRRREAKRNLERGLCGHGCLSGGQKDHSACNRNKVCEHYKRGCLLKAKCCGKYYPCRKCHDEVEDHAINRFETEFLACKSCGAEDIPVAESCSNCHVQFAKYSCMTCKFFDDAENNSVYHCGKCGICRVGAGLGIDNVHCEKCDTCVPIEVADTHKCTENALKRDCPVCMEDMATSTEQVVFMHCGHAIHMKCFTEYTRKSFTCPICIKSLTDMTSWYRALDATILQEKMPPGFANRRQIVYCHDCEVNSKAHFHFKYHKCQVCRGYNTRVICDAEDEEPYKPPTPKENESDEDDSINYIGQNDPIDPGCAQEASAVQQVPLPVSNLMTEAENFIAVGEAVQVGSQ